MMGETSRVLHVLPFVGMGGGAPRAMLTLVEELQRRRPTWVFSLIEDAFAGEARKTGAEVICGFGGAWPGSKVRRWAGTVLAIRRAVRQHRIDLIHCHSSPGNRYCYPASRLAGVPLVTHQRDTYKADHFHRWAKRTDHVIAISEWVRKNLPADVQGKVTVVHDAVRIPGEAEVVWPKPTGRRVVGMAGRCVPEKGHDLLVTAALEVMKRHDVDVEIWGWDEAGASGEFARRLRQQVIDAGMGERFRFEGYRLDMDNFYRKVDIVVVPSRVLEGFGLTAAEGQAWGKAVIAAGHGGLAEIVEHERTGLQFVQEDAGDLERQLERMLSDPEMAERLARAGRESTVKRFSPAVHADGVEAVYAKVLKDH
jgi:glycosyltransferase involved in cell wall biosynthesis